MAVCRAKGSLLLLRGLLHTGATQSPQLNPRAFPPGTGRVKWHPTRGDSKCSRQAQAVALWPMCKTQDCNRTVRTVAPPLATRRPGIRIRTYGTRPSNPDVARDSRSQRPLGPLAAAATEGACARRSGGARGVKGEATHGCSAHASALSASSRSRPATGIDRANRGAKPVAEQSEGLAAG